jgi:hypothetical protein
MKEHFPGCQVIPQVVNTKGSDPDPLGATTGCSVNPVLVEKQPWITLATLDRAFCQFGNMKCAGPDGFKPIVLKHLPQSARIILLHICNASINLQYTPLLWRNAEVVFIPKSGKDDDTNRRAFRPISLMPFFFKALESLVQWRMESTARDLHAEQHAFQKGHCRKVPYLRL